MSNLVTTIDPPMKVKYIGEKPMKKDTITGSGYEWKKGESLIIPSSIGKRLVSVQFKDIWVEDKLKKEEQNAGIHAPTGGMSSARKLEVSFPSSATPGEGRGK